MPGTTSTTPTPGSTRSGVAAWFGLDRRELGEELVGGDPDRAAELELVTHVGANALGDLRALAEQAQGAGDVEERLVERQGFDQGRVSTEDLVDLRADLRVQLVVARQEHRVGAAAAGDRRRERRVHSVPARLVRRRGHHATVAGSADDDRLPREFRPPPQLHRHVERIHVDVEDGAV